MKRQKGQLPLHLPLESAQARDDLVIGGSNRQAVSFLDSWPDWPARLAILCGQKGAGKSHLAQIWAARAQARFIKPGPAGQEIDTSENGNFVIESLSQGGFSEVWLFHLLNAARAANGFVLITARRPVCDWGIALPDLNSRLKAAHKMTIHEPDDTLLHGVLFKLFCDRQMEVDLAAIDYLVHHMERSLACALDMVARLDKISLASKRKVTRPLAAQILGEMKKSEEEKDAIRYDPANAQYGSEQASARN